MKRILTLLTVSILTLLIFGLLHAKERALLRASAVLAVEQTEAGRAIAQEQTQQLVLRQAISRERAEQLLAGQGPRLSSALTAWLLAGNFSQIPDSLLPEFRSALALPQNLSPYFILMSKSDLRALKPPGPAKNDTLSDSVCALLALSPDQRAGVDSALAATHNQFLEWARQNLQREGPKGDVVVRYTVPGVGDSAAATNQVVGRISDLIGPQRTDLLCSYLDWWFQSQTAWAGTITNVLTVLQGPSGSDGQPALLYELNRNGPESSLGQGPSEIRPQWTMPPPWNSIFPGGWPELAKRGGFVLPLLNPQAGR